MEPKTKSSLRPPVGAVLALTSVLFAVTIGFFAIQSSPTNFNQVAHADVSAITLVDGEEALNECLDRMRVRESDIDDEFLWPRWELPDIRRTSPGLAVDCTRRHLFQQADNDNDRGLSPAIANDVVATMWESAADPKVVQKFRLQALGYYQSSISELLTRAIRIDNSEELEDYLRLT